jgi:hypothetical protein
MMLINQRESDCEEICPKSWKIVLGAAEEIYSEDKCQHVEIAAVGHEQR